MERSDFYLMIEEIVEAEPGEINGNTILEDTGTWDSLSVLVFIAKVDEMCRITINAEHIVDCRTVDDLYNVVFVIAK